jgi:branched-subunit amino acid transport protein
VSAGWITVFGLALGTFALKAAAPLFLGGRNLPRWVLTLANRLPVPLLAALTVVSAVGGASGARQWHFDARLVGLAAAAVALWRHANFAVVVLAAAAATAAARAAFG